MIKTGQTNTIPLSQHANGHSIMILVIDIVQVHVLLTLSKHYIKGAQLWNLAYRFYFRVILHMLKKDYDPKDSIYPPGIP